ncbi:MAG: 2,3,4,5-tetrahydropyridine-2,6-dicarboxylate N-acetyltransferase [Candidatus Methanocomedens sp.]|nr:MAG: 2,3,4,5-tetrahydropyridine-2,6-dicarboxylate N-acetyltransferase [ANME-2 cluster archaeon]
MAQRALKRFPSHGEYNSLWYWKKVISPARLAFNYILMVLARFSPSLPLKLWLYRRMGIRIGNNVSIALEVTMDVFFPQLIEIGDNTIIGYNSTILCHEFLIKEYVTGPVVIGRDVMVGANTTILPGVQIADGSVVSAHSLVNTNIEGFSGGVPARPLKRT